MLLAKEVGIQVHNNIRVASNDGYLVLLYKGKEGYIGRRLSKRNVCKVCNITNIHKGTVYVKEKGLNRVNI